MQLARKTQKIQCIYDFFLIKSRHNSKIFSVMWTSLLDFHSFFAENIFPKIPLTNHKSQRSNIF